MEGYTLSADMSVKLTKKNIKSFLNHFLREEEKTTHSNENIDNDKSCLNRTFIYDADDKKIKRCNSKSAVSEAIYKRLGEAIDFKANGKMYYKNTGKSVRQDAAMCICSVIQLDPEFYKDFTEADGDTTLTDKANFDLLKSTLVAERQMFGKENVIALSLHLDETNPHIHVITTPVTDDCRLSKKDFVDKVTLKKFHQTLRNDMHERGYAIDMDRKTNRSRLSEQEYKDIKDSIAKEKEEELKQKQRDLEAEYQQMQLSITNMIRNSCRENRELRMMNFMSRYTVDNRNMYEVFCEAEKDASEMAKQADDFFNSALGKKLMHKYDHNKNSDYEINL